MPRYKNKPREITAEQFRVADVWPPNVEVGEGGQHVVWNGLHASYIKLKDGDYVRTDDPNDSYPIDEETFARTWELITTEGEPTDA